MVKLYSKQNVASLHWDIAKLLEIGVQEKVLVNATEKQITDLLKGLLYLKERYPDQW